MFLALDTSQPCFQLGLAANEALAAQGQWLFQANEPLSSQRQHSALLVPALAQALAQVGASFEALTTLAVCIGPGSFTGVRSGVVTARALAQFAPQPFSLAPYNQLELLASALAIKQALQQPITVALEARRGWAYQATYQFEPATATLTILQEPSCAPLKQLAQGEGQTPGELWVSQRLLEALPDSRACQACSIEATLAEGATLLAMAQLQARVPRSVAWANCLPLYLQQPVATVKKAV
jgi:tRNA threonylcarbamoyladenosine biosynthesis protein TsaB